MHILILAHEFPPVVVGGIGTYLGQLANGLASEGVRLSFAIGGSGLHPSIIEANRQVHFYHPKVDLLTLGSERFGLFSDLIADEVAHRCEAEQSIPDIIHCNNWFTFRCAHRLRQRWGRPIVSTVHSLEHLFTRRWGVDTLAFIVELERELCRSSNLVIGVSQSVAEDVRRVHAESNVIVIHNGAAPWPRVDPKAYKEVAGLCPDEVVDDGSLRKLIIFAGRLVPQKGLRFLLHAFRHICTSRDDLRLVVAGDGPEDHAEALREFSTSDPILASTTRLVGKLDRAQLRALYARSAVAVVPSLYEPFGYAAIEAMAAGVPLVVSRVGGLVEIVQHGQSGVHVEIQIDSDGYARIDADELAAAIVDLVDDPAKAQRISEAGRARAAEFTSARMADLTLRAYRSLLDPSYSPLSSNVARCS
ncbi:glycosyltransferase family 4 protein [Aquimonas sp.]|jgi:glycosyltransferase involved in cell wall biosynthesis|uniref:glycosyltransferase family 4 protein n=1 Tax=Aquimonas sp. TaxID=1872588 RepID=UPI0037BFEE6E